MSFTAMWLMALKRIESWIYWIIIDVIGTGLYYTKDVKFVSLLYVILLFLAIKGFVSWINASRAPEHENSQQTDPNSAGTTMSLTADNSGH